MTVPVLRKLRNLWGEVNGLVTIADLLEIAGFWLYRGTTRRTMSVAVAFAGLLLIDHKVDIGVSLESALTGTSTIFVLSFLGGVVLMLISGSIVRSHETLAEAKGSNLLEDMKKARAGEHRQKLWDHVYSHELALVEGSAIAREAALVEELRDDLDRLCLPHARRRLDDERRRELKGVMRSLGLTFEGFELAYDYAIGVPMSRSMLYHRLRYDLAPIKFWYDGAPFHHTDTKLGEWFDGSEVLQAARADAGLGLRQLFRYGLMRYWHTLWFRVITHAVQQRIARASVELDRKYPPHHFATDHFLWPGPQTQTLVRRLLGEEALTDLVAARRKIIARVLDPDPRRAVRLMRRALLGNFEVATLLRAHYDPYYVSGELERVWSDDVARFELTQGDIRDVPSDVDRYARRRRAADALLAAEGPLPEAQRRALLIAVHLDLGGFGERLVAKDPAPDMSQLRERISSSAVELNQRLLMVRLFHELCRLELDDYAFYIERVLTEPGETEPLEFAPPPDPA